MFQRGEANRKKIFFLSEGDLKYTVCEVQDRGLSDDKTTPQLANSYRYGQKVKRHVLGQAKEAEFILINLESSKYRWSALCSGKSCKVLEFDLKLLYKEFDSFLKLRDLLHELLTSRYQVWLERLSAISRKNEQEASAKVEVELKERILENLQRRRL